MQYSARLSLLPALIASAFPLYAADTTDSEHYTATLPTVTVVGQSDTSVLKGYINYDEAAVTRNGQLIKETPQTVRYAQHPEKQKLRHERFEFYPRRQRRY
ncbi:tonB-denpendent receptor [Morococcus cerebrosus]|uniref:TonB-denpendent receptor n=1 Tax=Morococcus cerebrosus TaxID=1056807 RepID=A0A0C1EDN0_9NEIS|nr:tonB-denpendent receptor [Morococcus cerebrosus]